MTGGGAATLLEQLHDIIDVCESQEVELPDCGGEGLALHIMDGDAFSTAEGIESTFAVSSQILAVDFVKDVIGAGDDEGRTVDGLFTDEVLECAERRGFVTEKVG